eukprot:jgi/Bigna1/89817/estExt_fgenesh1_pg.C_560035
MYSDMDGMASHSSRGIDLRSKTQAQTQDSYKRGVTKMVRRKRKRKRRRRKKRFREESAEKVKKQQHELCTTLHGESYTESSRTETKKLIAFKPTSAFKDFTSSDGATLLPTLYSAPSTTHSAVNPFMKSLLKEIEDNEKKYNDGYVPIHHVYCASAVIYEVYSALAAVLLGWEGQSVLPRLHTSPFLLAPNASVLKEKLKNHYQGSSMTKVDDNNWGNDHNATFRSIAIAGNTSLYDTSEATPSSFASGYCACGVGGIIDDVLSKIEAMQLKSEICELAGRYRYPLEAFGTSGAVIRSSKPPDTTGHLRTPPPTTLRGNLLQIFIRKDVVDDLAYGCFAYGRFDPNRPSLRKALESAPPKYGQCRLSANPKILMDPNKAKIFQFSADEKRHSTGTEFQSKLRAIFKCYYDTNEMKKRAAIEQFLKPLPSQLQLY